MTAQTASSSLSLLSYISTFVVPPGWTIARPPYNLEMRPTIASRSWSPSNSLSEMKSSRKLILSLIVFESAGLYNVVDALSDVIPLADPKTVTGST